MEVQLELLVDGAGSSADVPSAEAKRLLAIDGAYKGELAGAVGPVLSTARRSGRIGVSRQRPFKPSISEEAAAATLSEGALASISTNAAAGPQQVAGNQSSIVVTFDILGDSKAVESAKTLVSRVGQNVDMLRMGLPPPPDMQSPAMRAVLRSAAGEAGSASELPVLGAVGASEAGYGGWSF